MSALVAELLRERAGLLGVAALIALIVGVLVAPGARDGRAVTPGARDGQAVTPGARDGQVVAPGARDGGAGSLEERSERASVASGTWDGSAR